ncbi:hypothetical protein HOA92_05870 [archaeon]|nr:hypothetical protein [archaeon]
MSDLIDDLSPLSYGLLEDVMQEVVSTVIFGKWENWTTDDFKTYCEKNYSGMSRSEIKNDNENGGARFYQAVDTRDLNDEVLPASKFRSFKDWKVEDFKKEYDEKHAGMSKKDMRSDKENGGSRLLNAMQRRRITDEVVLVGRKNWKHLDKEGLKDYLKNNFDGFSRSDLRIDNEDGNKLYNEIRKRGLLDELLPINFEDDSVKNWNGFSTADFQRYYKANFDGWTRSEVKLDEARGRRFYAAISHRDVVDEVIAPVNRSWKDLSDEDLQNKYNTEFNGWSRSQLKEDKGYGSGLCHVLRERGLLDKVVPLKVKRKPHGYWKEWSNVENEIAVLVEEFGDFPTTSQLRTGGSSLRLAIKNFGGLESVKQKMGYGSLEMELLEELVGGLTNG